ncbi:hypothetical protein MJO28_003723 [Puccinia striiformis f. sp. tritici]|uniref:Uncharacterized protein n=1 Tax=Puccinia striiformis f. sp. tritici TaxID=168172 RepID=A0ACC0ELU6_9BASI|nr:hypothetical protein MJO28_003723 [Puccinia striiformis f. sp. tritici]KAI9610992.1 hypothetical protein H4Q26_008839 [Puccinia striiformis f. sp. tritici PST-130]KAI9624802.1 hypothetical protein KEM48_008694 [Puccinia striiformis f. sp. tritici PST-130]
MIDKQIEIYHVGVHLQPESLLPSLPSGFSSRSIIAAGSQASHNSERSSIHSVPTFNRTSHVLFVGS